jgi:pimeloyl-ACP methyl ester carboxylesterase
VKARDSITRTLDDLAADLDGLLDTAGIPAPYLLVGSSGGGMVDVQFAKNHPESVAGLALLDVGVPNPNLADEYPDEANANNPEHVHWFNAECDLSTLSMPIGDFPVLVVAAEGGDMPDQSFWLDLSPDAEQIVMPGGHDLYQEYPEEVAAQILTSLEPS